MKNVLITGGAGFIGSRLAVKLQASGYSVTILDNLLPQVHGVHPRIAPQLEESCRIIIGDVRSRTDMEQALAGQEIVIHLAAETGTGQSMYEIGRYVDTNIGGTATLLDLAARKGSGVAKLVVASSRAVYGEGKYHCVEHGAVFPVRRSEEYLAQGLFEPRCPLCQAELHPEATDENSLQAPTSVYGITKLTQESLVLNVCAASEISSVALRFQNVYGPGQSLTNPYTGILSIFSTQLRSNRNIEIFEDGRESRDFVYIDDVIDAIQLAIAAPQERGAVFNVGSGEPISVLEVAETLKGLLGSSSEIRISGRYRIGDIRHNFAALDRARCRLGFDPKWRFTAGIRRFVQWAVAQEVAPCGYEDSLSELKERGLLK